MQPRPGFVKSTIAAGLKKYIRFISLVLQYLLEISKLKGVIMTQMETRQIDARHVKKGTYIIIDDVISRTTDNAMSKPGKHGEAKCRIEAVGVLDGKKRVIIKPAGHNMLSPVIDKRKCQVLHIGEKANVMDLVSYEVFDIDIPEDMKDEIVEGGEATYWVVGTARVFRSETE